MALDQFKIFDNDVAQDTITLYEQALFDGYTDRQASQTAEASYEDYDPFDDRKIAVLALAMVQHKWGRVNKTVLKEALAAILEIRHSDTGSQSFLPDPQELDTIEAMLISEAPKRVAVKKPKPYSCPWNIGDVFAFPLTSRKAVEHSLAGRYILMQKVRDVPGYPKDILPVVRFKITPSTELPYSFKQMDVMEYVQVWSTEYSFANVEFREDDKWAGMGMTYEEACQAFEDRRRLYPLDENGRLREYQEQLYITSSWHLPANWIHLGKFPLWTPPKMEFVPKNDLSLPSVSVRKLEEMLVQQYVRWSIG